MSKDKEDKEYKPVDLELVEIREDKAMAAKTFIYRPVKKKE